MGHDRLPGIPMVTCHKRILRPDMQAFHSCQRWQVYVSLSWSRWYLGASSISIDYHPFNLPPTCLIFDPSCFIRSKKSTDLFQSAIFISITSWTPSLQSAFRTCYSCQLRVTVLMSSCHGLGDSWKPVQSQPLINLWTLISVLFYPIQNILQTSQYSAIFQRCAGQGFESATLKRIKNNSEDWEDEWRKSVRRKKEFSENIFTLSFFHSHTFPLSPFPFSHFPLSHVFSLLFTMLFFCFCFDCIYKAITIFSKQYLWITYSM